MNKNTAGLTALAMLSAPLLSGAGREIDRGPTPKGVTKAERTKRRKRAKLAKASKRRNRT